MRLQTERWANSSETSPFDRLRARKNRELLPRPGLDHRPIDAGCGQFALDFLNRPAGNHAAAAVGIVGDRTMFVHGRSIAGPAIFAFRTDVELSAQDLQPA